MQLINLIVYSATPNLPESYSIELNLICHHLLNKESEKRPSC